MPTFPYEYGIVSLPSGAVGAASSFQMRDQSFVLAGLTFPALTTGAKALRGSCAGSCIARGAVLTAGNHALAGTANCASSAAATVDVYDPNKELAGVAISKAVAIRCSIPGVTGGAWNAFTPVATSMGQYATGDTYAIPLRSPKIINAAGDMVLAVQEWTTARVVVYHYAAATSALTVLTTVVAGNVIGTRTVTALDVTGAQPDESGSDYYSKRTRFEYSPTTGRWYCCFNGEAGMFFMSGDTAGGNIVKRYMNDHDTTYVMDTAWSGGPLYAFIVYYGTTVVFCYQTAYTASGKDYITMAYLKSTDHGATWGTNTRPIAWGNVNRTHRVIALSQATALEYQMYMSVHVSTDTGTFARVAWIDFNANTVQTSGMVDNLTYTIGTVKTYRSGGFIPRQDYGTYPLTIPDGYMPLPGTTSSNTTLATVGASSDAMWQGPTVGTVYGLGTGTQGDITVSWVKSPISASPPGYISQIALERVVGATTWEVGINMTTNPAGLSTLHTKYLNGYGLAVLATWPDMSLAAEFTYLASSNRTYAPAGETGFRIYKITFASLVQVYYMELRDLYGYGRSTASLALSVVAAGAVVDIAASVSALASASCDVLKGVAHDIACPATATATATLNLTVGGVVVAGVAYGYSSAVASLRYTNIYLDGIADNRTLSYCALYVSHVDLLSGAVSAVASASATLKRAVNLSAPALATSVGQAGLFHQLVLAGGTHGEANAQATLLREVHPIGEARCTCTATLGMLRGLSATGGGGIAVQAESDAVTVTSGEETIWVM